MREVIADNPSVAGDQWRRASRASVLDALDRAAPIGD
jgi:hypothetical protein